MGQECRPSANTSGGGDVCVREGTCGNSVLSTQFCCALNSALKINDKTLQPAGLCLGGGGDGGEGRGKKQLLL